MKLSLRSLILYLAMATALVSCAQKPTKVNTKIETPTSVLMNNVRRPVKVTANTIVVDARKRFDYQMAHFPGAIHLRWESFTDRQNPFPGRLLEEQDRMIQRLALKGIHPDKHVIIIGEGNKGDGSSGRLAWTLFYLGVRNITVIDDSVLPLSSNIEESSKPSKNQKIWTAPNNQGMLASKNEVLASVSDSTQSSTRKSVIIDTRTEREYFKKKGFGRQYALPDLGAMNIEWIHFYNERGRPELSMRDQLRSVGIMAKTKIILISDTGLRSAAVHFALLSIGFQNVKTYIDGYAGLLK